MQSRTNAFIQQLNYSTNQSRFHQYNQPHDIIDKLLQTQDLTNIRKLTSTLNLQKRKQLLVDT
jgi:hypothetical protein